MSDFMGDVAQITGRLLLVQEACAQVCLSHREDCPCMVCGAAHGDVNDLWAVAEAVERDA